MKEKDLGFGLNSKQYQKFASEDTRFHINHFMTRWTKRLQNFKEKTKAPKELKLTVDWDSILTDGKLFHCIFNAS